MRLDLRSIRAVGLAAWGALFGWLWLSGESVRYLGPRTQWVIPVGAIGLTLAAAGYVHATRDMPSSRARPLELFGLAALLVPILAAATLAHAQLGRHRPICAGAAGFPRRVERRLPPAERGRP
jgi:uncharacterized membrane protein